jgi:N6-L-threonylcarbamoyladenine synthase
MARGAGARLPQPRAATDSHGGAVADRCGTDVLRTRRDSRHVPPGPCRRAFNGGQYAKGLAYALSLPLCRLDHTQVTCGELPQLPRPCAAVLLSGGVGGHSHLFAIEVTANSGCSPTRDDAAGEAFDKVARALDLPYPGGRRWRRSRARGPERHLLPRGSRGADAGFFLSGWKTAVSTTWPHRKAARRSRELCGRSRVLPAQHGGNADQ